MRLNELKIDPEKVEQGDWVDNIPEMEGLRLKVRGLNNASWRKLQRKLIEAVPRQKRPGGRVEDEEIERITSQCLLTCCLDDWDGLTDENDQPLAYSLSQSRTLLFEPQYRRFRDAVQWAASFVGEQKASDDEEITKN